MRALRALLAVLAVLLAALPAGAPQTAPSLTARGPIVILSNSEFTRANGVVNGSGAAWDPFVIEGWDIQFQGAPQDAYDPRAGLFIRGTDAYFVVRNCRIVQNADRDGVKLQELRNAQLEDVEVTGSRGGIHLEKVHSAILQRVHVHGNAGPGLVVREGTDHLVKESRFLGNQGSEVRLESAERAEFSRNEVRATRSASGLDAKYVDAFVMRDNRLSGQAGAPGGTGVFLEGVARAVVSGNEVRDFADDGLVLFRSSGGELQSNTLTGNGHQTRGSGLRIQEASEARATGNQVLLNEARGIELQGASRVTLSGNLVQKTRGPGIELLESSYNLLRENALLENAGPGLLLNRSSHNDVQRNQVRENRAGAAGALVVAGNDNFVAHNRVAANDGPGIRVEVWMSGNEIRENDVRDNEGDGILSLAAKERNTIRDNLGTLRYDASAEARAVPTGQAPVPAVASLWALLGALLIRRGCRRRDGPTPPA